MMVHRSISSVTANVPSGGDVGDGEVMPRSDEGDIWESVPSSQFCCESGVCNLSTPLFKSQLSSLLSHEPKPTLSQNISSSTYRPGPSPKALETQGPALECAVGEQRHKKAEGAMSPSRAAGVRHSPPVRAQHSFQPDKVLCSCYT